MTISYDDLERLQQIKDTIKELVYEAQALLPHGSLEYDHAKSCWLHHMLMALDAQHDYLGGSMCTMQDTINNTRCKIPLTTLP